MTQTTASPDLAAAPGEATPTPSIVLNRRGLERLDFLLLTVEALDLNGGEAMLWMTKQLGYAALFPNRVELWKRRCTNPLRRSTRRTNLNSVEIDALIRVICAMADRLYPMLHQLLSSREPAELTAQRWGLVDQRLRDLIEERMNLRRSAVQRLLDRSQAAPLQRQMVLTLALAAGPGGAERLRASLQDPMP